MSTRRVYLRTRVCVSHIILHTHTNGLSLGHTHDRCYLLHGQPPRTAHLAQSSDHSACLSSVTGSSSTPQGVILTPSEYEEYLRLTQAAKSSSIASVAQTGNISCLTHSSAPWILDTGASDHISGNKDLFSSLTFPSPLPIITLANGSQTIAKGNGSRQWLSLSPPFLAPYLCTLCS